MLKATECLKYTQKKRQSWYSFYTWGHFSIYGISILSLASTASLRNWSVGFFLSKEKKPQIWRTSKLNSILNVKNQSLACLSNRYAKYYVSFMPLVQLSIWEGVFIWVNYIFYLKAFVSQVPSLSIQSPKSAKEDVFSYPVLTLLCPAALVFVPAPAAQTAWCCTETQSVGWVHCHHCETSLQQQQRDPGSVGKKGEAQTRSYTAKQDPGKKNVFISWMKLYEFKQSNAALKSASYTCLPLFRITTLYRALV